MISRRNLMRRRSWLVWIKHAPGLHYWLARGAKQGATRPPQAALRADGVVVSHIV